MKRDKSHEEQIQRWAEYVKSHPKEWKSKIKPFLDSQIIMARRFYKKLAETKNGEEKIIMLKKLNSASSPDLG